MAHEQFGRLVFVNCPFDDEYAPLLEAAVFCIIYLGFIPKLANIRLEAGESRLEKIISLMKSCRYSFHDLSRCKSKSTSEFFRMNMPFEFGVDLGFRRGGITKLRSKKLIVFENEPYDLKRALSDVAGQDVEFHKCDFALMVKKLRHFFRVEANIDAPGPARILSDYATYQAWLIEKKISEGHSESEALELPTQERLDEMQNWMKLGRPMSI